MSYHHLPLVNEADLASARRELGEAFARILGYYRQDGVKSISAIEAAMHDRNATAMVLPAHSFKSESRQLGAEGLARLAQHLEMTARRCIEQQTGLPDDLEGDIALLRPLFHDTVLQLERIENGANTAVAAGPSPHAAPMTSMAIASPASLTTMRPLRPVFGRRAV